MHQTMCVDGKDDVIQFDGAEECRYDYRPITGDLQDVHFQSYRFVRHNACLSLAHFALPTGLRLEVSRVDVMGAQYYSVMRIERNGDRDYYCMQRSMSELVRLLHFIRKEESEQ